MADIPIGAKWKRKIKRRGGGNLYRAQTWQLYSMCAIPLLLVLVFSYLPIVGLTTAFTNYRFDKGLFGSDWVGIGNFTFFLKSNDFFRVTWNTMSLNFIFIISSTFFSVFVAILLYQL